MRHAWVREIAALVIGAAGLLALAGVLALLAAAHDWVLFGGAVGGMALLIVSRSLGRWDPEAALQREEIAARNELAGRSLPPLPPDPAAT